MLGNKKTKQFDKNKIVALILAGGSGGKFWPRSTNEFPEQFINLIEDKSLFQRTFDLITETVAVENTWIVINKKYKLLTLEQSPQLKPEQIIAEPFARHTAPAVGLALALLDKQYSADTVFCVFPSDQYIKNFDEFHFSLDIACKAANDLKGLITIGIEPTRPETHYGYIQYSEDENFIPVDNNSNKNTTIPKELFRGGLRKSINFAEKPDKNTAQRFIYSGDFVWNSGILIARKDVLFNVYEKFLNYHYEQFRHLQNFIGTEIFEEELDKMYKTFNKVSIDYGVLENAENVFVVKSTFTWTDLNDWDELHRVSLKDASNNVLLGNVISLDSKDTLAISEDKLVAILGLEDIIVINTENAILLCKKNESHRVEEFVEFLKKKNISSAKK